MARSIIPLLVCLVIAPSAGGCSYLMQYRIDRVNSTIRPWLGRPVHEVVSAWGPPTTRTDLGGSTVWEWRFVGETRATTRQNFSSGYTTTVDTDVCRKWFDVDEGGTITKFHWQGDC